MNREKMIVFAAVVGWFAITALVFLIYNL